MSKRGKKSKSEKPSEKAARDTAASSDEASPSRTPATDKPASDTPTEPASAKALPKRHDARSSRVQPPRTFARAWNEFFFAARDPRLCSVMRIGFAVLVLINVLALAPDLQLWFSDTGVLPLANARLIINEDAPTLLAHLPLGLCYGLLLASSILLLVGWQSRIQAVIVLVMLTSFQDRNYAIVDGEDTLFRLFAFYLALCPAGWAFSVDAWLRKRKRPDEPPPIPWALRLFQIQMSIIYLSSAIEKSSGTDWTSGKALYYVARLDDSFGKLPVPAFPFESLALVKVMTWSVLVLEWVLPVLLWVKRSRKTAIIVGIAFHLAVDWTMNLFLFHWIMILGLVSYAEYDELPWIRWRRRK